MGVLYPFLRKIANKTAVSASPPAEALDRRDLSGRRNTQTQNARSRFAHGSGHFNVVTCKN